MSSIESLKEQARRHEQKEEWGKALALYQKAIDKLAEEDQPDIGLYNRVGDLHTRTGNSDEAVASYESAVDLYLEADLPNNAIAVCKKILRNLPDRHAAFLRMGQIRAEQGFLVDARQNFLTYAERVQADGDLDEALRALVEFADLAPDDTDIRMAIALQFHAHERAEEAVAQLVAGYSILRARGDVEAAGAFEAKIREIDPDGADGHLMAGTATHATPTAEDSAFADFGSVDFSSGGDDSDDDAVDLGFAEIGSTEIASDDDDTEAPVAVGADEDAVGGEFDLGGFDLGGDDDGAGDGTDDGVEEDATPLPMMGDDSDAAADEGMGGDFDLGGFDMPGEDDAPASDPEKDAAAAELEAMAASLGSLGGASMDADDEDAPEGGDLPFMSFEDEDEDDDAGESADLPFMSFDDEDDDAPADGAEAAPIDTSFDLGGLDAAEDEPVEAMTEAVEESFAAPDLDDGSDEAAQPAEADIPDFDAPVDETPAPAEPAPADTPRDRYAALAAEAAAAPGDVGVRQRMLETAYQVGDDAVLAEAHLELAKALSAAGNAAKAQAMYQQVLVYDPANSEARAALDGAGGATRPVSEVAAAEDYVDLGSLILGGDEEKTTRFTVAYEEPSGDEEADFAKMLSQFKSKVAENFDASDVRAHHDLGTAYKEMGLLDEAIEEFQAALRASADHLATYELLGQVFMEKGQYDAAARVLTRAIDANWEVEDELLGIYYYLGRAKEELGDTEAAVGYYDQVFSLDINFADVTERLRNLR